MGKVVSKEKEIERNGEKINAKKWNFFFIKDTEWKN